MAIQGSNDGIQSMLVGSEALVLRQTKGSDPKGGNHQYDWRGLRLRHAQEAHRIRARI
jgi:hypothetical protein